MKGILFTTLPLSPHSQLLLQTFQKLQIETLTIDPTDPPSEIPQADWIWPRLGWRSLKNGLRFLAQTHAHNLKCINSYPTLLRTTDKLIQWSHLRAAGIPVPDLRLNFSNSAIRLPDWPEFYVKSRQGSQGYGVLPCKAQDWPAVEDFLRNEQVDFFIQKKIEGEELRILLLGDEVLASVQKVGNQARKNLSRESAGAKSNPSDAEVALARKAASVLGLDFTGIDLIRTPDGPVVLECNAFPGFIETQKAAPFDLKLALQKWFYR